MLPESVQHYQATKEGLTRVKARLEEDEAAADAESDSFRAAGGAELAEDRRDMKFDGVLGDGELGGDFLIAQSTSEHLKNFAFARGKRFRELLQRLRAHCARSEPIIHGCGDLRGVQHQEAACRGLQCGGELIG